MPDNTVPEYDTRITAVRTAERLLLRRHSNENVLCEEYALAERITLRDPLVQTVGIPEPGLPMTSTPLLTKDAVEMFSALVRASRETGEISFSGQTLSGSYRREMYRRGRYVLTELFGSDSEVVVGRISIDAMDLHLLERALEQY